MTDPSVPLSVSITSIATALGMGILVGAIRERHSTGPLAGLRTHAIVALLGVVTFGLGPGPYIAALAAVGALAVVGYVRNAPTDLGLTGETALLLNMALAGLAVRDPQLAAGLGVVAAMLLQAKAQLQNISRNIVTEQELKDALLILAALLVVMPLLPHHAVDPWGVLDPRTVWMIVVLVMAMGMLGHVAMRMAGVRCHPAARLSTAAEAGLVAAAALLIKNRFSPQPDAPVRCCRLAAQCGRICTPPDRRCWHQYPKRAKLWGWPFGAHSRPLPARWQVPASSVAGAP